MSGPVTLHDVALAAGVHPSTVSRTLSRPELVNVRTRHAVEDAVRQLGYVPNRAARRLAGGRTATVAILVPDVTNPFFAGIVRGAQRTAAPSDRLVVLADTGGVADDELAAVRSLAADVDGFVACAPVASSARWRDDAAGRPVVFVNRRVRDTSAVVVDQQRIAALAVGHLRALGHERVAVLDGPASYWSSAERGRRIDDDLMRLGPFAPTVDGGRASLDAVLAAAATGVVAFNDLMALGLVAAASEAGVRVPDDLSVVGSDDVPFAALARPALTTVAAPLEAVGAAAMAALDHLLADGDPEVTPVEPTLVVRASTAAPHPTEDHP